MTGTIVALAANDRRGTIRAQDGMRLAFSAAAVLGDFDTLAVGHRVSFDIERDRSLSVAVRVFREPAASAPPARKPEAPPDLRYAGFDQAENVRRYRFDAVTPRSSVQHFVTVDVTLLMKHRIAVQEAPVLCLHKVAADLKESPDSGRHQLGEDDLLAFASSRAALQRKRPKHPFRGRRGTPPPGPSEGRRY